MTEAEYRKKWRHEKAKSQYIKYFNCFKCPTCGKAFRKLRSIGIHAGWCNTKKTIDKI